MSDAPEPIPEIANYELSDMFILPRRRSVAAADLAREYGIDASAVTRLIHRLEKRGLITRLRSEEDRRVVRLALTEEGRVLAGQIPAIFTKGLDKLLSGFTPEEGGFLKKRL